MSGLRNNLESSLDLKTSYSYNQFGNTHSNSDVRFLPTVKSSFYVGSKSIISKYAGEEEGEQGVLMRLKGRGRLGYINLSKLHILSLLNQILDLKLTHFPRL